MSAIVGGIDELVASRKKRMRRFKYALDTGKLTKKID